MSKRQKGLKAIGMTIYDLVPDMDEVEKNVLSEQEAAKLLNTSVNYLRVMRSTDRGPHYSKFEQNKTVYYFRHELLKYKKSRKRVAYKKTHNGPKKVKKNLAPKS